MSCETLLVSLVLLKIYTMLQDRGSKLLPKFPVLNCLQRLYFCLETDVFDPLWPFSVICAINLQFFNNQKNAIFR